MRVYVSSEFYVNTKELKSSRLKLRELVVRDVGDKELRRGEEFADCKYFVW